MASAFAETREAGFTGKTTPNKFEGATLYSI